MLSHLNDGRQPVVIGATIGPQLGPVVAERGPMVPHSGAGFAGNVNANCYAVLASNLVCMC